LLTVFQEGNEAADQSFNYNLKLFKAGMANHDVSVAGWLTAGHTRKWALDIYPAIKADLVRLTRILSIMKHLHSHFVHLYVHSFVHYVRV